MTTSTQATRSTRSYGEVWERYSGGDIPATLGGLLAAIGTFIFVSGLTTAGAGNIAYQVGVLGDDGAVEELSIAGALAAVAVLFASFFVGGWVAARMARFDGPKNGLLVALWMTALVVIFGALGIWFGNEYNAFAQVNLPDWVSQWDNPDVSVAAGLFASVALLSTFAGGFLGGLVGENYNARANAAIANARPERIVAGR